MPGQGSRGKELGDEGDGQRADGVDVRGGATLQLVSHECGHDGPRQPKIGVDDLQRRAEIHDVIRQVAHTSQRSGGRHVVTELSVVVILEDDRLGVDGPLAQPSPSVRRHSAAQGILMSWRDIDGGVVAG